MSVSEPARSDHSNKRHKAVQVPKRRILPSVLKIANKIVAYLLMIGIVLAMALPLLWMVASSIKTEGENLSYPPTILPQQVTFDNYRYLFQNTLFLTWFKNSVIVALTTTFFAIALSAMGAYAFSRFRYKFFEGFSRAILFAYMVPTILLVVPIFKIVSSVDLHNTIGSLIIVYIAFLLPYGLWTLRSYFSGAPREVEDAALIDGCNRLQAFVLVVLPQVFPGIISTALFAFYVAWNEYLYASVLLWSSNKMTLSAGVSTLMGDYMPPSWSVLMAAGVMVTLPVIILFSFLQSFFVAGWGGGAVKG